MAVLAAGVLLYGISLGGVASIRSEFLATESPAQPAGFTPVAYRDHRPPAGPEDHPWGHAGRGCHGFPSAYGV